jgi:hypothetical protein
VIKIHVTDLYSSVSYFAAAFVYYDPRLAKVVTIPSESDLVSAPLKDPTYVYYDIDAMRIIDSDKSHFYTGALEITRPGPFFKSAQGSVPSNPIDAASAPAGLSVNYADETITGVSSQMEYSTDGESWTAVNGSTINISGFIPAPTAEENASIGIRFKKTVGYLTSAATDFEIVKRSAAPLAENVKFDSMSETITTDDTMEYRIGTSGGFTPVPEGATSIPANVGAKAQSYYIRVKAGVNNFISAPLLVSVPARRGAPGSVYNAARDAVVSVNTAMEYSLDGGTAWISCTTSTIPRSELL